MQSSLRAEGVWITRASGFEGRFRSLATNLPGPALLRNALPSARVGAVRPQWTAQAVFRPPISLLKAFGVWNAPTVREEASTDEGTMQLVRVPGDGRCLFRALALGRHWAKTGEEMCVLSASR